jgi:hypothetical protein
MCRQKKKLYNFQTDRQADRWTNCPMCRQKKKPYNFQTDRQAGRQMDKLTDVQTEEEEAV